MLLFQSLQFLGDEVLHLLDVHATAPLQKSIVAVRRLWREAPGVPAQPGGTHIVLCLQVARLLAQEAKHAGEVLVPDLAEDLQRAPQLLHTRPTSTCTPAAPFPAQPPPGALQSTSMTHCHHGTMGRTHFILGIEQHLNALVRGGDFWPKIHAACREGWRVVESLTGSQNNSMAPRHPAAALRPTALDAEGVIHQPLVHHLGAQCRDIVRVCNEIRPLSGCLLPCVRGQPQALPLPGPGCSLTQPPPLSMRKMLPISGFLPWLSPSLSSSRSRHSS